MANIAHRHVYSASLHYPMPIWAIDPICPQDVLQVRVTLFTSGMLCVINIPSTNGNDTSFCSELNREHAGESFMSLRFIVFEICSCKIEKLSILRKFDL